MRQKKKKNRTRTNFQSHRHDRARPCGSFYRNDFVLFMRLNIFRRHEGLFPDVVGPRRFAWPYRCEETHCSYRPRGRYDIMLYRINRSYSNKIFRGPISSSKSTNHWYDVIRVDPEKTIKNNQKMFWKKRTWQNNNFTAKLPFKWSIVFLVKVSLTSIVRYVHNYKRYTKNKKKN